MASIVLLGSYTERGENVLVEWNSALAQSVIAVLCHNEDWYRVYDIWYLLTLIMRDTILAVFEKSACHQD